MDGFPKRKSNRLPQFDYGTVCAYFITICSRYKAKVFGRVVGGGVLDAPRTLPSPHGKIVIAQIEAMENFYPGLQIEKFVVMPNHIHLIVAVIQSPTGASRTPPPTTVRANQSIPAFVSTLKRMTNRAADTQLWQRGYYDHIIRDQLDYDTIWRYIDENPAKWHLDRFYIPEGEKHP